MGRPTGTPEFDTNSLIYQHRKTDQTKLLHKLGSIQVWFTPRQDLPNIFEILRYGVIIANARTVKGAFQRARINFPRKPRIVRQEIMAVRGWGLMGDILTPVTRPSDYESWSGPVATAELDDEDDTGPGLYCVKPFTEAINDFLQSYNVQVYGLVALSGRVIEYELGYRAQRATVRHLIVRPPVGDIIIKALGDRYQCNVKRDKDPEATI